MKIHLILFVCACALLPLKVSDAYAQDSPLNSRPFQLSRLPGTTPAEEQLERRKNQPVFIFIPGVLGSKLQNEKGDVIWGAHSFDTNALVYNPNIKTTASLLESYDLYITKSDVYGEFFKTVDAMNTSSIKHLLIFPYDWRQDNTLSAQQLDDQLKKLGWAKHLAGRNVIFVSHSMGGLVARRWFHEHFKPNEDIYPFKVREMIFLGTPHYGAPSALQTVIEGYSTNQSHYAFIRSIESALFKALSSAGYSFPSTYQLLPIYDNKLINVYDKNGELIDNPSAFDIATWIKYGWVDKFKPQDAQAETIIKKLLQNGLEFQSYLWSQTNDKRFTFFYSASEATTGKIRIDLTSGGGYKTTFEQSSLKGDGRVPQRVAKYWQHTNNTDRMRSVVGGHGVLPKAEPFIRYVRDIRDSSQRSVTTRLASLIINDPSVAQSYASLGKFLSFHGNADDFANITNANRTIVQFIEQKHGPIDFNSYWTAAGRSPNTITTNTINYDLALTALQIENTESRTQKFWKAQNMAHSLFRKRNDASVFMKSSKYFSDLSVKTLPAAPANANQLEWFQKSLNTQGAINYNLGSKTLAKENFEKAAQYGSPSAVGNLKKLYNN